MRIGEYAPGGLEVRERPADHHVTSFDAAPPTARPQPDALQAEAITLLRLGIGKPTIARAAQFARRNGTTIEQELLANGMVDADSYYAALARALRVPFLQTIDASLVSAVKSLDTQLITPQMVRLHHISKSLLAIVPEAAKLAALAETLAQKPGLAERMVVTTPSAMRAAVWTAGAERRLGDSVTGLFENERRFSARIVVTGKQGFVAGICLCALSFLAVTASTLAAWLHLAISLCYLGAMLMRGLALFGPRRQPEHLIPSGHLPVYTVMVALYRETEVAAQLIGALGRLNWPASRLDIKLVCEADDHATIAALKAAKPGPQFEIVEVPAAVPRTKPKALNYALSGARGEFIVVYDAEDRPHPDQLRAAYAAFAASPPEVICLQAPLVISNGGNSWITSNFALEYAALFRMLLPMLARFRLPLPLGGTSNHLRVAALRACGGWDPYNVTEDADLGMRLYRLGYRCGVIDSPTFEDAPGTFKIWMNQRTRWFKGWLQTWLVMMREPVRLLREMGPGAFLTFQLLVGGMLLSSFAHPWIFMLLVTAGTYVAFGFPTVGSGEGALFVLDAANMLASYGLFLLLGRVVMLREERRKIGWKWTCVPLYWLMISIAAWRALFELPFKPFFWNKTPHKPADGSSKPRAA